MLKFQKKTNAQCKRFNLVASCLLSTSNFKACFTLLGTSYKNLTGLQDYYMGKSFDRSTYKETGIIVSELCMSHPVLSLMCGLQCLETVLPSALLL